MGMSIKSDEAERLTRELAAATGESLTEAVTVAVRERLERVQRHGQSGLAHRLLAIGADLAPRLSEPYRSASHDEILYDDRGLPK
jgi:antitoxin VapB